MLKIDKNLIKDPRTIARLQEKDLGPTKIKPLVNSSRIFDVEINRLKLLEFDPVQTIHESEDLKKQVVHSATKQSLDIDPQAKQYKELSRIDDITIKAPRARKSISKEYQQQKLLKPEVKKWYIAFTREEKQIDQPIVPLVSSKKTFHMPSLQFVSTDSALEYSKFLIANR